MNMPNLEIAMDYAFWQDESVMTVWKKEDGCTRMVAMFTGDKAEVLMKILSGEQDFSPIINERGEK